MQVLIVEDDQVLADILGRNVRARGHNTTIVHSAEDASAQMFGSTPDALLLDVNLPDYSGWEVLRRLNESARQSVSVVVMSAFAFSPKRIEEFKPVGALLKPFPITSLVHVIDQIARNRAVEGANGGIGIR